MVTLSRIGIYTSLWISVKYVIMLATQIIQINYDTSKLILIYFRRQGRTLADFIEKEDKKTITEFALSWCKQLMLVMMCLDEQNIIHNDLKPA